MGRQAIHLAAGGGNGRTEQAAEGEKIACRGLAEAKLAEEVQRKLAVVRLDEPREAGAALTREDEVIGELTTVVDDLALAFVDTDQLDEGTPLDGATVLAWPSPPSGLSGLSGPSGSFGPSGPPGPSGLSSGGQSQSE